MKTMLGRAPGCAGGLSWVMVGLSNRVEGRPAPGRTRRSSPTAIRLIRLCRPLDRPQAPGLAARQGMGARHVFIKCDPQAGAFGERHAVAFTTGLVGDQ